MSDDDIWKGNEDIWQGEVVECTPMTKESMIEALELMKANAIKAYNEPYIPTPPIVHPIGHRDMLVAFENYSKEKANKIVLKMAKDQGFSKDHIAKLKENLEK